MKLAMREQNYDLILKPRSGLTTVKNGLDVHKTRTEEISAREMLKILRKRKWAVIGFAAAIFGLIAIYTFVKTPIYQSVARLHVDPRQPTDLGLNDGSKEPIASVDTVSRVLTDVRILESNSVAFQTMKTLSLSRNPDFAGKYTSFGPVDPFEMDPQLRDKLLELFSKNLTIQVVPNTEIVEVRFQSRNPMLAAQVVNEVVNSYMAHVFNTRFEGTVQVSHWLSKQVDDLRVGAEQAQQNLAEFERKNGIVGADEKDNIVADRLKQLNEQLTSAEADRVVKEARYRVALSDNPELIASIVPNSTLQILRGQEADLRNQIAQLSSKYGTGYPKLKELQSQLERLQATITAEVHNTGKRLEDEYLAAQSTEGMLQTRFDAQKSMAFQLNEGAGRYAILKREVESTGSLYDTLQLKLKEAGITAGLSSGYISVVDHAIVSAEPVSPKKLFNLALGLTGGLIGGVMLAFALESLDETVQTSEEVEQIAAFPVLASIPLSRKNRRAVDKKRLTSGGLFAESNLFAIGSPDSEEAEAYRAICTWITLKGASPSPKVLVVASALPGDGKTTVSANLAVALAQRGDQVLLVDADLRRSSICDHFGLPIVGAGLANMITTGVEGDSMLTPLPDMPNLKIVPAGPPSPAPAQMLASPQMTGLLARWAQRFDRIVVDTSPLLAVSDAFPLAAAADGVLVVFRPGTTRERVILRVRDLLARSDAQVLGAILNGTNKKLDTFYYPVSQKYGYQGQPQ